MGEFRIFSLFTNAEVNMRDTTIMNTQLNVQMKKHYTVSNKNQQHLELEDTNTKSKNDLRLLLLNLV